MKEGVLVLAHGSKRKEANEEISLMVNQIRQVDPQMLCEVAFMSFGQPGIADGIALLVSRGVNKIIIMPFFLVTGNHIIQDIPEILSIEKKRYPDVEFRLSSHLAGHPGLVDIVLDRIRDVASLKRVE